MPSDNYTFAGEPPPSRANQRRNTKRPPEMLLTTPTADRTRRACFAASAAVVLVLTAWSATLGAAPVKSEHVQAELVSERTALVPGQPITLALRLKMADGWHTYWRNPGDSGLPTTIAWKLPDGFGVGAIQWPAPRALPAGPLVNYGYEGEVLVLSGLTVPPDAPLGTLYKLEAHAAWLGLTEIRIPEGPVLDLQT